MAPEGHDVATLQAFTIKEMVVRILSRFDKLDEKIETLVKIERVEHLERRIQTIETEMATTFEVRRYSRWLIATIISSVTSLIVAAVAIVSYFTGIGGKHP